MWRPASVMATTCCLLESRPQCVHGNHSIGPNAPHSEDEQDASGRVIRDTFATFYRFFRVFPANVHVQAHEPASELTRSGSHASRGPIRDSRRAHGLNFCPPAFFFLLTAAVRGGSARSCSRPTVHTFRRPRVELPRRTWRRSEPRGGSPRRNCHPAAESRESVVT